MVPRGQTRRVYEELGEATNRKDHNEGRKYRIETYENLISSPEVESV